MSRISTFAAITLISLSAASCGKDDDNNKTRAELIAGRWTTDYNAKDFNDNKVLDASETQPIEFATHTYNADGTGTVVGKINMQQTSYSFSWMLTDADRSMRITMIGGSDSIYIEQLTENKFVLQYMDDDTLRWVGLTR